MFHLLIIGTIDLNDSNIFAILNAASFLQLNTVVNMGCDYLKTNLNISNCISIRRFSDEQSLQDLKLASFKFILDQFELIAQNDDLIDELNSNELTDLLNSSYLNVLSEEIVYETLMRWISLSQETRSQNIASLLSCVKLPLLKSSYLTRQIETNQILVNNLECQSLILEAVTYHLNPEKMNTTPIERTNPRKSTVS